MSEKLYTESELRAAFDNGISAGHPMSRERFKIDDYEAFEGAVMPEREWINADTPPPRAERSESLKVLVYKTDINGQKDLGIMRYNNVQGFWNTLTGTCKVTHWKPLPSMP